MVRFGADIALLDLLVDLASCDRRADSLADAGREVTDLAR
jgi:hypothetical protein